MMASSPEKKQYNVSYFSEIQKSFPFTTSCPATVTDHKHKFCYTVCDKHFSLVAGGADNICHLSGTKTHKDNARQKASKYLFLKMCHLEDCFTR